MSPSPVMTPIMSPMIDDSKYSLGYINEMGEMVFMLPDMNSNVIDVTDTSNGSLLALMDDGSLIEIIGETSFLLLSPIYVDALLTFSGKTLSVANGKIHALKGADVNDNLIWDPVKWSPMNIIHWSKTLDDEYLWVQNTEEGFLFDKSGALVNHENTNKYRTYGENSDIYVDLSKNNGKAVLSTGAEVDDVFSVAFNHDGMTGITSEQHRNGIMSIKFLSGQMYYICKKE
jgi:hypothetical protein